MFAQVLRAGAASQAGAQGAQHGPAETPAGQRGPHLYDSLPAFLLFIMLVFSKQL